LSGKCPASDDLRWHSPAPIAVTTSAAETKPADAEYAELLKRVAAGDFSIDFRALRMACVHASACDPRGDSETLVAMRRARAKDNEEQVVREAQKLIESGFPNIEAHVAASQAYAALNRTSDAEFHHHVASALLQSIFRSGDGRSKETAFEVIGTHEEYIVLAVMALPRMPVKQSLISGKPHSYDLLEVKDPKTGKTVAVWFNIDAFYPMKGL